jgi:hypothetical protein
MGKQKKPTWMDEASNPFGKAIAAPPLLLVVSQGEACDRAFKPQLFGS